MKLSITLAKKHIIVILILLSAGIAYAVVPNPGHSWSSIECDDCILAQHIGPIGDCSNICIDASGGEGYWSILGGTVYPTNTAYNVSIGTNDNWGSKLHIDMGSRTYPVMISGASTVYKDLQFRDSTSGERWKWTHTPDSDGNRFEIWYHNGADWITTPRLSITTSGNVGIGTASPDDKLHIDQGGLALSYGINDPYRYRIAPTSSQSNLRIGYWTTDWYPGGSNRAALTINYQGYIGIPAGYALYFGREEVFEGSDVGGSDYGYIRFDNDNNAYAYWGDSFENSALIIGAENDGMDSNSDVVVLKSNAAVIVDAPRLYGWAVPSDVKRTTATHNGNFGGYNGMYNWIQSNGCAGYHVCDEIELIRYFQLNNVNEGSGWYAGGYFGYDFDTGSTMPLDTCTGWTSEASTRMGNYWIVSYGGQGAPYNRNCASLSYVMCCK